MSPVVESQAAPGTPLEERATDNGFATGAYTLVAGQAYTLTLTNSGAAVHNWHVLGIKGPNGKEIATPLTAGGKSSSVTFTIAKPGTYRFQCDVHPDEMTGTLLVR